MTYESLLKELFFLWQDSQVYEKEKTYENILQYLDGKLSCEQISELEDLLSLDTFDKQLQAFEGGIQLIKKIFLLPGEDLELLSDIYKERVVIKIILSS